MVPTPPPAPAAAAAPDTAEPDSALVAACRPAADGSVIDRVLLVVFLRRATDADRKAAVKAVGGRLGGDAPGGETYVAIPATPNARTAADRMIRQRGVSEVSEQYCP